MPEASKQTLLKGRMVFVLDDEKISLVLLKDYISAHGATVIAVDSPHAMLDLLRWNKPDIVLLDVMMEGLNGFEVYQKLRELPQHHDTPTLFITGMPKETEESRHTKEDPRCMMISKFLFHEHLLPAIQHMLENT